MAFLQRLVARRFLLLPIIVAACGSEPDDPTTDGGERDASSTSSGSVDGSAAATTEGGSSGTGTSTACSVAGGRCSPCGECNPGESSNLSLGASCPSIEGSGCPGAPTCCFVGSSPDGGAPDGG